LIGESKLPVAVLATPDGSVVKKVENTGGKLKVVEIEKLVGGEIKTRGTVLDTKLADAKAKAASGDKAAAIELYRAVAAEKCMFAKKAKAASADTAVVVHPTTESMSSDRSWLAWLERATGIHGDVRVLARLPAPTGMR